MADSVTELTFGTKTCSWLMTYPSEDEFLRRIVFADLPPQDEQRLLAAVVIGVARPPAMPMEWVDVHLTQKQVNLLGLNAGEALESVLEKQPAGEDAPADRVGAVIAQCPDVSEQVLSQQTMLQREQLLYRQWSELEAIHRAAPVGLLLLDVQEARILRVNERQAQVFGAKPDELLGRKLFDLACNLYPGHAQTRKLFARATNGEIVQDQVIACSLRSSPDLVRCCRVTFSPTYDPCGRVYAVTVAATSMTPSEIAGHAASVEEVLAS